MNEPQEDEPYDVTEPREVPQRTKWKMYHAVHWINLKSAQDRGVACWQTHSNVTVLDNSVPADCLEKVVRSNTEEIRCQKIHFSLPLPRNNLSSRAPGISKAKFNTRAVPGEPVADEMKIEPKIDFRIQGLSCAEVEQDEEKSRKQFIERLGSATTKQKKNALIAELQSKHPKTPLSRL